MPPRLAARLALAAGLAGGVVLSRLLGAHGAAAVFAALLLAAALAPALARLPGHPAPALLAAGALAGAAWASPGRVLHLMDALPVAGYLLLGAYFGRTLLPGREPLIARYTRFDYGHLPPECAPYARGLTALWTATFLGAAAAYLATLLLAPGGAGHVFAAIGGLMLAVFLGEHAVRSLVFPQYGIASPIRTCRAMILADAARHA